MLRSNRTGASLLLLRDFLLAAEDHPPSVEAAASWAPMLWGLLLRLLLLLSEAPVDPALHAPVPQGKQAAALCRAL